MNDVKCKAESDIPTSDQNRREQRGNGGFTDPAEAERGHGDAQLATREIGLNVAQHHLQQASAEAVLLCHRVDAKAPALHQSEFRGNVKSVGGEQEYGDQQTGDRVVHRVKSFSARKARTSPASTSRVTKAWPMPRTRMKVSRPR